ncbi:hypothetical protein DM01DRAFT_1330998 [Hesseltinella vesiculosa]|uniref:Wax synthase domain-containing protein n=1 Tax=Hesseltinella vesiculosa TaxID=101127 RepID=A0A1X2GXS9_9FUNG|nr:hypothetical protein DM01DRAFT_1330998 [Hesseltinella vesiculosa]
MDYIQLWQNGERITLNIFVYAFTFAIPSLGLTLLIATPWLPGIVKQTLAMPLLLANILYPLTFTSDPMLDLVGSPFNFSVLLRFLDLFYVSPIVYHRPVYASTYSLWVDFWSCLRKFPKPAREATKDVKKGEIRTYTKDRSFLDIIPKLLFCMATVDVLGSYLSTFTPADIMHISKHQPVTYFMFYAMAALLMTAGFNIAGYSLHLFYSLFVEGGSYSSEQYRMLMIHPMLSSSLDDVWSRRWHQLFRSTWLAFPFRPTRTLTQRLLAKTTKHYDSIALFAASVSVFFISGLMHEYMVVCNVGWPLYKSALIGQQTMFFTIHGCGVILEKLITAFSKRVLPESVRHSLVVRVLQHIWVIGFGFTFLIWFMEGFATWNVYNDNPFQFTRPLIHQYFRTHPALHPFVGSAY